MQAQMAEWGLGPLDPLLQEMCEAVERDNAARAMTAWERLRLDPPLALPVLPIAQHVRSQRVANWLLCQLVSDASSAAEAAAIPRLLDTCLLARRAAIDDPTLVHRVLDKLVLGPPTFSCAPCEFDVAVDLLDALLERGAPIRMIFENGFRPPLVRAVCALSSCTLAPARLPERWRACLRAATLLARRGADVGGVIPRLQDDLFFHPSTHVRLGLSQATVTREAMEMLLCAGFNACSPQACVLLRELLTRYWRSGHEGAGHVAFLLVQAGGPLPLDALRAAVANDRAYRAHIEEHIPDGTPEGNAVRARLAAAPWPPGAVDDTGERYTIRSRPLRRGHVRLWLATAAWGRRKAVLMLRRRLKQAHEAALDAAEALAAQALAAEAVGDAHMQGEGI
jgi:hypothetical protein